MANYKSLFLKAKKEGISELEITVTESSEFSFSLFHNEIDNYSISDSFVLNARGIYNGKIGYASSEKYDSEAIDFLIDHIKENATLSTSEDKPLFFPGSKSYKKKNVYNKKLDAVSNADKVAVVKKLDARVREKSKLIQEVETSYSEAREEIVMMNTLGLNLKSKNNYAYVYCAALAVDEEGETKNGYDIKLFNDLDSLDIEKFSDKVVKKTLDQFGSKSCASDKYKCVLSSETVSNLIRPYLSNLSSEEIQKNSSLMAGKLHQQIASEKLTVMENPLEKNVFFRYFDDEGVATSNKTLIKNGVLETYLYNLNTAAKDDVHSTGNGYKSRGSNAIGIDMVNIKVKPGRLSEEGLIKKCKKGIYIDQVSGLHAGLNAQSGNFSLLAQGFLIEKGELGRPVTLITAAGNLYKLFEDVQAVGNNLELHINGCEVPSLLIKEIAISGE